MSSIAAILPQSHLAYPSFLTSLDKRLGKGTPESIEASRWLVRNDLFFLLVVVLGRRDANNPWAFARCREVQAAPNGFLDLWAREHYKSTIITFALTIQEILRNPETTIGIFSHTRPIAKAFLRQIMREFETNELLKGWF